MSGPAVKEARRGSQIWLDLGDGLHRRDQVYELGGAGLELVLHGGVLECDLCELVNLMNNVFG